MKKQFPQIIDVQIHIDPLDDTVKGSVLSKLPGRNVVEQDLQQAWEQVAEREQVIQTRLHYLDQLLEIDLVLPVSMSTPDHETGVKGLQDGANSIDYIGKVNIYYVK